MSRPSPLKGKTVWMTYAMELEVQLADTKRELHTEHAYGVEQNLRALKYKRLAKKHFDVLAAIGEVES